ncbi:hypothetical protein [Shimia abyssi]|uniref:hypothetical protein n=1 Tax=Shimia abyssi TaxID=1662395 RepID=UPI0013FD912F|nr:hypothetical protein [Shimia abyssi]
MSRIILYAFDLATQAYLSMCLPLLAQKEMATQSAAIAEFSVDPVDQEAGAQATEPVSVVTSAYPTSQLALPALSKFGCR